MYPAAHERALRLMRDGHITLYESHHELHDQFRSIAAFDIVANNTDRKGGHCLIDADDHVWGIDNGSASPRTSSYEPSSGSSEESQSPIISSTHCVVWSTRFLNL